MSLLVGTKSGVVNLDGDVVLASVEVNHIGRSKAGSLVAANDGTVWTIGLERPSEQVAAAHPSTTLNCVLDTPKQTLIGASEARVFVVSDGALVEHEGFMNAPGRESWYTPWGGPPDVRSMDLTSSGAILANIHVGGILRSDDERNWSPTIDMDADVHQVIAGTNGTALAATAYGLAVSGDDGVTWHTHTKGLHAMYCRAAATAEGVVLVSASLGPRGQRAAVYRAALENLTFKKCDVGLPEWFSNNVNTSCLAWDGGAFYIGDRSGTVYESRDQGETWDTKIDGLPAITCLAAA